MFIIIIILGENESWLNDDKLIYSEKFYFSLFLLIFNVLGSELFKKYVSLFIFCLEAGELKSNSKLKTPWIMEEYMLHWFFKYNLTLFLFRVKNDFLWLSRFLLPCKNFTLEWRATIILFSEIAPWLNCLAMLTGVKG